MAGEAWWCPACCAGVDLGEEAWKETLAPIAGVDDPLCPVCGTELGVHPERGTPAGDAPAREERTSEPAPWELDADLWKGEA
jgi:hypothetical protein